MERITPKDALDRLNALEQQGMKLAPSKDKKKSPKFVRTIDENVYLFERDKGGFVAPAYAEINPLLGEYEEGDDMPPALQEWLEGYAAEMDWYAHDSLVMPQDDSGEADTTTARKDIAYMCKAVWGQGAPYNQMLDFGWGACLTGCWATAVGIIMQYWGTKGYHRGCTATTPYWYVRHPKEFDPLPPKIVFDYRNITAKKPTTAAQKKAIAEMMLYIGMACQLDYGVEGTGVSITHAMPFLKNRLRMGDGIKSVQSSSIGAEKFEQKVYDEISAGRPCIIRGANSKNTGGHFFVADGYRKKDSKFHINWGWSGSYNGYFALAALTPTQANDYTYYKWVIEGIKPDYYLGDINGDGTINITDAMLILDRINNGDTSIIGDVNSDGTISVADMMLVINTILGKEML